MPRHTVTYQRLVEKLLDDGLLFDRYKSVPWLISPSWFEVTYRQVEDFQRIGSAIHRFLNACNALYFEDEEVTALMDDNKPREVVELQKSDKVNVPLFFRPDFVMTSEGPKLVEIEVLVGGMGMHAKTKEVYLSEVPTESGAEPYSGSMVRSFMKMVQCIPDRKSDSVLQIPSDYSRYIAEFNVFSNLCRREGYDVESSLPRELGNRQMERFGVIRRFFDVHEFRDLDIPHDVVITPPLKHFFEEKLWLALFWSEKYEEFWQKNLGNPDFELLRKTITPTWVIRHGYLPKNPEELSELKDKERQFVTKMSGYDPRRTGGGRSFVYVPWLSNKRWKEFLSAALTGPEIYVMQEYQDSLEYTFPVFIDGELRYVDGWYTNFCPYYFVNRNGVDVGDLAVVLRKSRNVHGAEDGLLLPVSVRKD